MNRTSIIHAMCGTFNHSYGLMTKEKQEFLFKRMAQIFDNDIAPNMEIKIEKTCKNCKYKYQQDEFFYKCCGCIRGSHSEEADYWESI